MAAKGAGVAGQREATVGPSNLVLIGMPGAGKSTVGVLLAKRLAKGFVDTDLLIQQIEGEPLQAIVDRRGYRALRAVEARELCRLEVHDAVIATGGSAVYSEAAMAALARDGRVIYLHVPLAELAARISNMATRGLAKAPGQSFEELFQERAALYRRYAELTVDCSGCTPEQTLEAICRSLP